MKRTIKIDVLQNRIGPILDWLKENDYRFEIRFSGNEIYDGVDGDPTGALIIFLEVYSDEAEVATRLKWDVK